MGRLPVRATSKCIHPIFDGDEAEIREYHEENLRTCDGVMIFYGAGNEPWLRRKLRELQKSAGYGRTKADAGVGDLPHRAADAGEGTVPHARALVIPQWDGCRPMPLQPFVARSEARGQSEPPA